MNPISIEIKARCPNPVFVRKTLKSQKAVFKGLDHQIDTYFRVPLGRLKLREGNIENALIYYKRSNQKNSKRCDSILYPCAKDSRIKSVLKAALGVLTVVDKKREIYFIKNVERLIKTGKCSSETPLDPRQNAAGSPLYESGAKFHIDRVKRLGQFVEIEVFGPSSKAAQLRCQCEFYQKILGIRKQDLLSDSYSDQLLRKSSRV